MKKWREFSTDRKEGYVLRKYQRDLTSVELWCELWNITINEDKIRPPTSPIDVHRSKLFLH
jgi:hypothetical protein